MSLLVVGSVAFDCLKTPKGQRDHVLGGAASYFSLAASHFTEVQVVAVVGEDFTSEYRKVFAGRSIDLSGLVQNPGKTFVWKGRYDANLNEAETLETHLNVFQDFNPVLPEHYKTTPYLFLGNIEPTLQAKVLASLPRRPLWVALDTMNLWIQTTRASLLKVLREVDILLVNDKELQYLVEDTKMSLADAYAAVCSFGPRILVVKRGDQGATLFTPMGTCSYPAYPVSEVVDPTGAGDSFAGGFLGYLAQTKASLDDFHALQSALRHGCTMASFTVEAFSTEALERLNLSTFQERLGFFEKSL